MGTELGDSDDSTDNYTGSDPHAVVDGIELPIVCPPPAPITLPAAQVPLVQSEYHSDTKLDREMREPTVCMDCGEPTDICDCNHM